MRVETTQLLQVPDNKVFVEEFTVFYGEDGLNVKCKSDVFAAFVKKLSGGKLQEVPSGLASAFEWGRQKLYWPASRYITDDLPLGCLDPVNDLLMDPQAPIGANLSFLLTEGLEDGITLPVKLPVSTVEAQDFYYGCLQAFQSIYIEWIRPFSISAVLREVTDDD